MSSIHPSAWKGNSANFALTEFSEVRIAPVHYGKGALAPHASPPDATQGIVHMQKGASKGYCVALGFRVWCIHSKHWESACSQAHPRVLREGQTRREAGAQSLRTS